MGFIGVLLVSLGALSVATATECVPETAKCSKYWVRMFPHKNLMKTEDELQSWCSKQDRFYRCLEDIFLEGKNGNVSYLPTNLLISKLFTRDICTYGSKNRERLLNNAECINQLDTDFCVLPEYLDIVTSDDSIPSATCSQSEKTFSCIAATMVLNCGFDAARVYRAMLKITRYSDEVCGIEMSYGIPPCEGRHSKSADREQLSDIYYGLYHRIGDVLDDQNEVQQSVSAESYEYEAVTEAIESAIDNLDKNLVAEELLYIPEHDSDQSSCSKDIKDYKPYMKNPHITEFFRGMLQYNYSGIEYAIYWRQPEFTIFDKIVCQQLLPSYQKSQIFQCRTDYRYYDPDCVSNSTVHEKVTPEFIRSFDPEVPCDSVVEFGPQPEWMKEVEQMYEEKRIRDQMASTSPPTATQVPEVITTSSSLLHMVSSSENFDKHWFKYADFRVHGLNSLIPNDIHLEIMDLVMPEVESYVPSPSTRIRIGDSLFMMMYDWKETQKVENGTCSRIDECHPKGRGLWKCKWWPRKNETCDSCGETLTDVKQINFGFENYKRPVYASPAPLRKDKNLLNTREPPAMDKSNLETTTPIGESIALVFSGDGEPKLKMVDLSENESHHINELDFMKDDTYSEDESKYSEEKVPDNLDSDLDDDEVRLQILNNIFDKDEDLESSRVVYAIEDSNMEDGETEIIISTDGLLAGNIMLLNKSDLDETKYAVVTASPDFLDYLE